MKTNLLFSFSLVVCSLATLGGGAMFLHSGKESIRPEPPTLLPHPVPVDAAPPTLELPNVITVQPTLIVVPKVHRTFAKVEVPK